MVCVPMVRQYMFKEHVATAYLMCLGSRGDSEGRNQGSNIPFEATKKNPFSNLSRQRLNQQNAIVREVLITLS